MSTHYDVELQDALDGRLDAATRRELEAHLASCVACRAAYERLRWVKEALAVAGEPEEVSPGLDARVRAALDAEDRIAAAPARVVPPARRAPIWGRRSAAAVAAGLLVVGVVVLLSLLRGRPRDPVDVVAQDFARYRSGVRALDLVTDEGERLRSFFAGASMGFHVRVLDLRMMGYRLIGGSVEVVDGRRVALLVYRADPDRIVFCAMYLGTPPARPGGEVRQHAGISFHVHRVEGTTVVWWQEGDVTCALASDGQPEDVVQLAFAKAMKTA